MFPSIMCSPNREYISLVTNVLFPGEHISQEICVPLSAKHISLVILVPYPSTHIGSDMCFPTWEHTSLVTCFLSGKHISLEICLSLFLLIFSVCLFAFFLKKTLCNFRNIHPFMFLCVELLNKVCVTEYSVHPWPVGPSYTSNYELLLSYKHVFLFIRGQSQEGVCRDGLE